MVWLGWALTGCGGPASEEPQTDDSTIDADQVTGDEGAPAPQEPAPSVAMPDPAAEANAPAAPGAQLDAGGVAMLFPSQPDGSHWSLGTSNPNTIDRSYFALHGGKTTPGIDNGLSYWTTTGPTVRLNLSNPRDLKNFEATVYVRVQDGSDAYTSMGWKLRGGKHLDSTGALMNCASLSVPSGGKLSTAAPHPQYERVNLTPKFPYQLQEGKWLGMKVVSYLVNGETKNLFYLDTEPFDASGKARNDFKLYTECMGREGKGAELPPQAATRGGWLTTFHADGWRQVDFAQLSVREITPPAS